ncbi:SMI1/KNR4 family protein (plasmid) [Rhizobium sp. 32-5/1]|uniref:SMI1/KNR4 family protein n=1 Tax=Rhizobium sp. 32-5/1 TaxID=3019602 RepID=UPI00240DC2C5|nr:SMI1/KNR4 family protein [Rhizobium sp. 32-5/1]WEZ85429.1 SMI1/KNR4 family protein [Rhizobium sp. 32-5/1]
MADIPEDIIAYWKTQGLVPLSETQITEIEDFIGKKVPESYKQFMTTYGPCGFDIGGRCSIHAAYDVNLESVEKTVLVEYIYDTYYLKENQEIFSKEMAHYNEVGSRIPPDMLIIGSAAADTAGQILLNVSSKNNGSVWYWERVDETWGAGENTLLGLLGKDIFDVITRLERG